MRQPKIDPPFIFDPLLASSLDDLSCGSSGHLWTGPQHDEVAYRGALWQALHPRTRHNASLLNRLARRSHSWSRVTSSSVKYTFQGMPLASWYPVSLPTFSQ